MSFDFLGLAPETLRAVTESGYTEPTPIQAQAIPSVLMGRDIMGIAQTGTGKTAGFTLPMIDILAQGRARARMPRSLILEPTRELAAQVSENFEVYGKYHKLTMALLIGGVSFDDQLKKLDRGVDVLIATPGRLLDHFGRGGLMLNGVEILVIDEADRMMDMGFIPDVEKIVSLMPQKHQTLFFSATMPKEIKRLADRFLDDPKQIQVTSPSSTGENIEQFSCFIPSTEPKVKREKLRKLLGQEKVKNAIIFCNRKRDVDTLQKSLKQHGFNAAALHGDMNQSIRMEVLAGFKNDEIQYLIASDVAARGLDIPAVSHVFNFDVPSHAEDYIHRIGRTGRAGRSGRAFTLVTKLDTKYLKGVQDLIGKEIPPAPNESSPVDQSAVAEEKSERGGRNRRRNDRRGDRKAKEEQAPAKATQEAPVQEKPVEAEKTEAAPAEQAKQSEPRQQSRRDARPKREPRQRREPRDNNNRSRGRRDDDMGEPVVGLGDHMPAFLMQRIGSAETSESEAETKAAPKKKPATKAKAAAKHCRETKSDAKAQGSTEGKSQTQGKAESKKNSTCGNGLSNR